MMNDADFLQLVHDRIINVYGENQNVDFLHRLRTIIKNNTYEICKDCGGEGYYLDYGRIRETCDVCKGEGKLKK